jgi:serine/threonine protein phosphatase PrpC
MTQLPQLSACPECDEPLESGDMFCGACGADLSAPRPAAQSPEPAQSVNGTGQGATDSYRIAPAGTPEGVAAPPPPAHPPTLPGGVPVPDGVHEQAADGYQLAAPEADPEHHRLAEPAPAEAAADPRAALGQSAGQPAQAQGEVKHCVACRTGTIDSDGYCENCGHAQPRERDHMEQEVDGPGSPYVAAVSDRGLRHHRNEDSFNLAATSLPNGSPAIIAVVCDGVSSSSRPDEASAAASRAGSDSLQSTLALGMHPLQAMHEALLTAANAVSALAAQTAGRVGAVNAPACTCVSAVIAGGILTVGWVGDSRAYWVPDDRSAPPARLTEDDSWAAQMVASGLMSEADAYADERAHAITGWLGADAHELDPHTASFKPEGPGVVVVCTDGLWNYAEAAAEMAAAVPADARTRPLHSAQVLTGHALDGGGHDNVTVAVLPFPTPSGRADMPDTP